MATVVSRRLAECTVGVRQRPLGQWTIGSIRSLRHFLLQILSAGPGPLQQFLDASPGKPRG